MNEQIINGNSSTNNLTRNRNRFTLSLSKTKSLSLLNTSRKESPQITKEVVEKKKKAVTYIPFSCQICRQQFHILLKEEEVLQESIHPSSLSLSSSLSSSILGATNNPNNNNSSNGNDSSASMNLNNEDISSNQVESNQEQTHHRQSEFGDSTGVISADGHHSLSNSVGSSNESVGMCGSHSAGDDSVLAETSSREDTSASLGTASNGDKDTKEENEKEEWNEQRLENLFASASVKGEIEMPLCVECAENLCHKWEKILCEKKEELSTYELYMECGDYNIDLSEQNIEEELLNLSKAEQKLSTEEEELMTILRDIDSKQEKYKQQISKSDEEITYICKMEQVYWNKRNTFQELLSSLTNDKDTVEQKISRLSHNLDRLYITNIFNDSFHIWFDGFFGTINSFRLGRLPTQNVEWSEINGACGHAALLLLSLARHKKFLFTKYNILPSGSFTKLQETKSRTTLDFYTSGSGLFWQSKFDNAIVAFLCNIDEFAKQLSKEDPSFQMPYVIDNGKINQISAKSSSGDENWTRAMKYMLTNLKYLVHFTAK